MTSDPVVTGLSVRQMLPALGRICQDTPGFLLDMAEQYGNLVRFSDLYPDFFDNPQSFAPDRFSHTPIPTGRVLLISPLVGPPSMHRQRLRLGGSDLNPGSHHPEILPIAHWFSSEGGCTGHSMVKGWLENFPGENPRLKT